MSRFASPLTIAGSTTMCSGASTRAAKSCSCRCATNTEGAKLSLAATEKYVAALREQQGKPATPRLTAALLLGRVMRLREGLAPGRGKRRLEKLAAQLSKEQRARFASELRGLRDDLQALAAILNIDA
jgi:hypothetical protein